MGRLVKSVNVVSMTDSSNVGMSYTITATLAYATKQTNYTVVPADAFVIDPTNGSLFTNVLMTNFTNYYFAMQVVAKKESVLGASVTTARVRKCTVKYFILAIVAVKTISLEINFMVQKPVNFGPL